MTMLASTLRSLQLLRISSSCAPCLLPVASGDAAPPTQVRHLKRDVRVPKPGAGGIQYKYRVQLPEEYTIRKLPIQKLGGRDPVTGRVVVGTLGGGSKNKFRWVDPTCPPLEDGSPRQERVLQVNYDPLRTSMIALVANGQHLRWVIAFQGMAAGDLVTTYADLPRIPVRPRVGDSHPLGALPAGTEVFNVEMYRGHDRRLATAGGTFVTIVRKVGDRVIVQNSKKRQFSIKQECTCTVGRVQPRIPAIRPIGSAQRLRHLGFRPRSGLWQRKTGRFGRKVRRPPPVRELTEPPAPPAERLELQLRHPHILDRRQEGKLFRPNYGYTA